MSETMRERHYRSVQYIVCCIFFRSLQTKVKALSFKFKLYCEFSIPFLKYFNLFPFLSVRVYSQTTWIKFKKHFRLTASLALLYWLLGSLTGVSSIKTAISVPSSYLLHKQITLKVMLHGMSFNATLWPQVLLCNSARTTIVLA